VFLSACVPNSFDLEIEESGKKPAYTLALLIEKAQNDVYGDIYEFEIDFYKYVSSIKVFTILLFL
jgi:hypothetical protein